MDTTLEPNASALLDTSGSGTTLTTAQQPRLIGMLRIAWVALLAITLILLAVGLPRMMALMRQPCSGDACFNLQLTPEAFASLERAGLSIDFLIGIAVIYHVTLITIFSLVGGLLVLRRAFDVGGAIYALACPAWLINYLFAFGLLTDAPWNTIRALTYSIGIYFAISFMLTFPDGRFYPRWMRWFVIGLAAVMIFTELLPDGRIWTELFSFYDADRVNIVPGFLDIGLCLFSLFTQFTRYRRIQTPAQQRQSKWVVFALSPLLIGTTVGILLVMVMDRTSLIPAVATPWLLALGLIEVMACLTTTPIMIIASILRFRLWSVDLALNRALITTLVAMLLGALFAVSFGVIQGVLNLVFDGEVAGIALTAAALVALVGYRRVARVVRRFIDTHVYGLRFDLNELEAAQQSPTITHPGSLSGRTLGDFTLRDLIGKGGMGEVYLAQHRASDTRAAVKVLRADAVSDAAPDHIRARFRHEAQALALLNHPNIVKIIDADDLDGIHYIAMEHIDGSDLRTVLTARVCLSLSDVVPIIEDIAAALDYVHAHGLVHRDLKPSNIMLRHAGGAVLMDFGIAKLHDAFTRLTTSGGVIGTITYMSPEQIMSSTQVDHRSDIYGLGVVVYELLTGVIPFDGSVGAIVFAHLQQPPPDPRTIVADLPSGVAAALKKALEKEPNARHASASAFAAELRAAFFERTTEIRIVPARIVPPNPMQDVPTHAAI